MLWDEGNGKEHLPDSGSSGEKHLGMLYDQEIKARSGNTIHQRCVDRGGEVAREVWRDSPAEQKDAGGGDEIDSRVLRLGKPPS